MSKPSPIEFRVRWWTITYQAVYYESNRAGTYHFRADISYIADLPNNKITTTDIYNTFTSFEDAKTWIDQELES
jgi:hypothetical protein